MTKHLGAILVEDGLITPAQLEEALRLQIVVGGRLGTNLVEMSALNLDNLARALSKQSGVPAALQTDFDQINPEVVTRVPAQLAKRYEAVPLRVVSQSPKVLAVAFIDPRKVAALDEFRFALDLRRLQPFVAGELRIFYWLEKLYGIPRKARYLRFQPSTAVSETRAHTPSSAVESPPAKATPGEPPPPAPVPLNLAQAVEALGKAKDREEIGQIIVDWLRSAFGCGLVLIVRGELALGWHGFAPGCDPTTIESIAVPLGPTTAFRSAYQRLDAFRGPAPSEAAALQERLWKLLRTSPPKEILVAPIVLKNHVVNLVYAHAADGGLLSDALKSELVSLCSSAALAYARLIQSAKKGSPPAP